jgi:hypothetical protein
MEPGSECGVPLNASPVQADQERRCGCDRRGKTASLRTAFWPLGQRSRCRRKSDRIRPHFVDRFSTGAFVLIMMLLIASIVDAILTVDLLREGAYELNPLMDHFLEYGVQPFLLVKYLLTAAGLPVLLIYQHHYLFGTRVRVGYLIPVAVTLYGVLIVYQLVLINSYAAFL